ncbi:sulfatase family protein [Dyadobacter tibetensis]|uniref:sulfatase family protein n=1 Tax=Dyadobacter tibetensis TaxID=1211851 RepID=UPI00046FAA65|nr:sulfatase [Dyadobacter tibetensis]
MHFILPKFILSAALLVGALGFAFVGSNTTHQPGKRPNILFVISDDQSFAHASAYGFKAISTPAFDRVAREGVLFTNAFVASPGCSPSRAAILTGKNCWQVGPAGTHASTFPRDLQIFTDVLQDAGYFVGLTGKGWGPGKVLEREHNPAGKQYDRHTLTAPKGISNNDYAANFQDFFEQKSPNQPFCFWMGAQEPHRRYPTGIGQRSGMKLSDVQVPSFLPDQDEVKSDMLDYLYEIQWYDNHLGKILSWLEKQGELENTLVVVTSDNGMPFPRAKANCYEYGVHVPLAIRWGAKVKGGRVVNDLVSSLDFAPTFLDAAGISQKTMKLEGRSLMNILKSNQSGTVDKKRTAVFASRERHSSSRWNNHGYPQRTIRKAQFQYIWNVHPERWPAGAPQKYEEDGSLGPMHGAYHDIDDFVESPLNILRDQADIAPYFHMAVDKRPAEELYDIQNDPGCLKNLAQDPTFEGIRRQMAKELQEYLVKTQDPRTTSNGEIFESYIRYSPIRKFPKPE